MNAWQSVAVTVLVQVTAIISGAAIAMGFARRRTALRHAIGVVALAFLLVSPALTLLLPRAPWHDGGALNDAGSETALLASPAPQPARRATTVIAQHDQVLEEDAESVATRLGSTSEDPNKPHATAGPSKTPGRWAAFAAADHTLWLNRGFTLAAWIWAAGIVILCLRFFSVRRQLRTLTTSVQCASIDAAAAEEARRALGLKSLPPVGVSDLAPMPLVLGCWRPMVVLPRRLVETGATARLRDVLIHEIAHILRRDPWINFAQHIARVVFWPHPGVHWLNRQIARSREEVCDNFVLNGANSTDYAQTLLELAEHCGGGHLALSLLGMFSRRWSLEERISGILNPGRIKTTRATRKPLAVVTLLLAAICTIVGGVRATAQDSKESGAAPAPQAAPVAASNAETPTGATKKITLRGACHDQDERPVPNLWVRVFRCTYDGESPRLLGEVRSNDDGRFSIPDIEFDEAAQIKGMAFVQVVVTSKGYASVGKVVDVSEATDDMSLEMPKNPGTLSGVVTDAQGRPIRDVIVFLPCYGYECIPNLMSAVTDQQGRYAIDDLRRWKSEDTKTFDAKTGIGTGVTSCSFLLRHPDYALTRASYSGIPQEVNVVLVSPANIEGQVVDQVTGKPVPNVVVSAQGVARYDSHRTRTDAAGHYRLRTNQDHFNIWAEAEDRIAIAAKAVAAVPGKTVKDADIRMVRGGFVVGTVIDGATGKPVVPTADKKIFVAHYGPARPRTGAAVTSTLVNPDGTYRLRVAPGSNYVYVMGGGTSVYVDVSDSGETKLDLRTGEHADNPVIYDDPDLLLAHKLRQEAREEDEEKARQASGAPAAAKPPKRQRPDTPAGRLPRYARTAERRLGAIPGHLAPHAQGDRRTGS